MVFCVVSLYFLGSKLGVQARTISSHFYGPAIQMDWTIWKTAEPMTTKMNRAKSSVETG